MRSRELHRHPRVRLPIISLTRAKFRLVQSVRVSEARVDLGWKIVPVFAAAADDEDLGELAVLGLLGPTLEDTHGSAGIGEFRLHRLCGGRLDVRCWVGLGLNRCGLEGRSGFKRRCRLRNRSGLGNWGRVGDSRWLGFQSLWLTREAGRLRCVLVGSVIV